MTDGGTFTVHGEDGKVSIHSRGMHPQEVASGLRAALVQLYRAGWEQGEGARITEDDLTLTNMAMAEAKRSIELADRAAAHYRRMRFWLYFATGINLFAAAINVLHLMGGS